MTIALARVYETPSGLRMVKSWGPLESVGTVSVSVFSSVNVIGAGLTCHGCRDACREPTTSDLKLCTGGSECGAEIANGKWSCSQVHYGETCIGDEKHQTAGRIDG